MGFNARNNKFNHEVELEYNIYEPFGKFLTNFNRFYIFSNNLYKDFTFSSLIFRGETVFNTRKYFTFGGNNEFTFFNSYDYYEPRVDGWYFKEPPWGNLALWISTDYRKKFILDGSVAGYVAPETNSYAYAIQLEPRYQSNSRLVIKYNLEIEELYNVYGYVTDSVNSYGETVILFGRRDVQTITNVIEANYMFTSNMSLNFRARHYWVTAKYHQFYDLQKDGSLEYSTYDENEDLSYNLFNIDMSYIWNFLPGSQISVVWKNSISSEEDVIEHDFFENLGNTLSSPASNSFSVRILVYLDALWLKKRK